MCRFISYAQNRWRLCGNDQLDITEASTSLVIDSSRGHSTTSAIIDNHDSGYLGMAVQLYVQAHLGHYHILIQKEYSQKIIAQLKSTPPFTYTYMI